MSTRETPLPQLLGLSRSSLESCLGSLGEKPFRARQVVQWVHQHGVLDSARMTNLGKALRGKLDDAFRCDLPALSEQSIAPDGTIKWVLKLHDGNRIETVFIPESKRGTLCVSSQAGCALNCTFCSTARGGLNRNLSSDEIVAQLWLARQQLALTYPEQPPRISNVVFMGMGEPLMNPDALDEALSLLQDDLAYGLARRRITVSTSGVVPGIRRLASQPVSLAVSLHAPNDSLRNQLVPLNQKYPIAELLDACHDFIDGKHKEKITFEYVMLDGINDQPEHARQLARLLAHTPHKINLIPFNPFPGSGLQCSPTDAIASFSERLQQGGSLCFVRKTRGQPIDAACGQLVGAIQQGRKKLSATILSPTT